MIQFHDDVRRVPITNIRPNDWNPNEMPRFLIDSLKMGFKKDGFLTPIIVQASTGVIIDGEHRYIAAGELGLEEVLIQAVDCDDITAKKLTIVMNQRRGEFDPPKLELLLRDLQSADALDAVELGFHPEQLTAILGQGTGFLDDIIQANAMPAPTTQPAPPPPPPTGPDHRDLHRFQVALTAPQKDIVQEALTQAKDSIGEDLAAALVYVCDAWLQSVNG